MLKIRYITSVFPASLWPLHFQLAFGEDNQQQMLQCANRLEHNLQILTEGLKSSKPLSAMNPSKQDAFRQLQISACAYILLILFRKAEVGIEDDFVDYCRAVVCPQIAADSYLLWHFRSHLLAQHFTYFQQYLAEYRRFYGNDENLQGWKVFEVDFQKMVG